MRHGIALNKIGAAVDFHISTHISGMIDYNHVIAEDSQLLNNIIFTGIVNVIHYFLNGIMIIIWQIGIRVLYFSSIVWIEAINNNNGFHQFFLCGPIMVKYSIFYMAVK